MTAEIIFPPKVRRSILGDRRGPPGCEVIEDVPAAPAGKIPSAASKAKATRTNTNSLMATKFPPIKWIVPDYVPEGFSVLAGRQKLGKTWLAMDWSIAVASGGMAMGGIPVEAGNVLYIDLENGPRRIQRRIETLFPDERYRPDMSRLEWQTEAPALDKGLIDQLEDWRQSVPNPRLVNIDVLQRIKPIGVPTRNSYENDYCAWAPLQKWATEHGIAVVGLHHTRKGGADDPLESLSGSNGLSAVADTTLVLDRGPNGITLYARGRDADEVDVALKFHAGSFSLLGNATDVRRSRERRVILDLLRDNREPMTPAEIADALGLPRNNVKKLVFFMAKDGDVVKSEKRGRYHHPDNAVTDDPVTDG